MSLSYQKLDVVEVRDPRTILTNKRDYAILKAGSQTTMKQFTTTSVSNSSIQFSCPPPSGGIIVDRKIYLLLPIRLTFTGTAPAGQLLLNPNQDAPRAFPIASSLDTIAATINNQSVSINISDFIHALMRYNNDEKLSQRDYSLTPAALDQSQAYSQLFGTNRSPLSFYGDQPQQDVMSRAGFPFTIVSNTNTSAVVDFVACEPLFLPPFHFGKGLSSGFYNVNTMDFNLTFLGSAGNRMWSHDADSVGVPTVISSISQQFNNFSPAFSYFDNQPLMLFNYITPQETQIIPANMPITYPYFDLIRFPTDATAAINAGQTAQIVSNNIQLNSIPNRMYLFVRERNQVLFNSPNFTDTFFSIENINVQFQNKNGLLNSANKRQLYEMSVKNHCNLSWTEWSGENVYPVGSFANPFGTVGSVVAIEFASDIGLDSLDAPGKLGQYMLQVNVACKNISNRTITPTLYIVVVSEGTFTIEAVGRASINVGVITSQEILDARTMTTQVVSYKDVEDVSAGNFFTGLRDFGKKLLTGLRDSKAISSTLSAIPSPYTQALAPVARSLGFGEGAVIGGNGGGVFAGGRMMSRSQMRNR